VAVAILRAQLDRRSTTSHAVDFAHWLQAHRGAVVLAGLLAFAHSLISLVGSLSVFPQVTLGIALTGIFKTVALGIVDWPALLLTGYVFQRLSETGWRAGFATCGLAACVAIAYASIPYLCSWGDMLEATTSGWGFTVTSALNGFMSALLFFAHLQRSHVHEEAAKRLAAAQRAQREARRRLAQGRLQAVQARIDPQLLFDMLDAVRQAYECEPPRAEQLLDELVAFLRAALPRLQHASSSVPREAEMACACVRLHALAAPPGASMGLAVSAEVMDARFPPGVLLPLLNDALQVRAGACELSAARRGGACRLVLAMPARPSDATAERVRGLLNDLYGTAAELALADNGGMSRATIEVPYEHA
jgi:hypothetical protein